ncbi:MAG TPA: toast rack family protein [Anaerolineales bacterium]|nr:toast rack family protein [Anaerolineales bacterium]
MKRPLLLVMAALTAASLACSINLSLPKVQTLKTGPTETLTISEPLPDAEGPIDVTIKMGAGELNLTGGAEGLVEGEVRYNIPEWKPAITGNDGTLTIEQGPAEDSIGIPEPDADIVNEWNLKLGDAPMELEINAGAYDGTLDLSGVPLRRLSIRDGASNAEVVFDSLNPETMKKLSYETGASSVKLTGLANANFAVMDFTGGAGSYTLDFSGELQQDAEVAVKTGASSLRLVIPEGMKAKVTVRGGLSDVSTIGGWTEEGDTYETEGEGYTLTVEMEMAVGSLTLVNK